MAKDNRAEWQDARRQIIDKLDIRSEYEALGATFSKDSPSAKGWLPCYALFRGSNRTGDAVESKPSAAVNVGDSMLRGRYKDLGAGVSAGGSLNLFDTAVKAGRYATFHEALIAYAVKAGVPLPDGSEETPASKLDFFDPTPGILMLYAQGKYGVTVEAMRAIGLTGARWPRGLPADKTNHMLACPMYGPLLLDGDPCGWHCFAANPRLKIRMFRGVGNEPDLVKTMSMGPVGVMGLDGLQRLESCKIVNWTEGISDLMAFQAAILRAGDDGKDHICLSLGGANCQLGPEYVQLFAGKEHRIWYDVGDKDDAGRNGAAVLVGALLPVAAAVRNIELPLGPDSGKNDFRQWANG